MSICRIFELILVLKWHLNFDEYIMIKWVG